jgi:hypothetical protein
MLKAFKEWNRRQTNPFEAKASLVGDAAAVCLGVAVLALACCL